jgi:hypothetical protein
MYHLMRQGILEMIACFDMVCADQNAILWIEASSGLVWASSAEYILWSDGGGAVARSQEIDVVLHKPNDG